MHAVLEELSQKMQAGKVKDVKALVAQALAESIPAAEILNDGLLSAMSVIGEKFKRNEVYVPEVLIAARAMKAGMEELKPHLSDGSAKPIGKACIGTVYGDQHDIGKNLVKLMLEGKGIEVIDLGVNVPAETFIETVRREGCQLLCLSALLTVTMTAMKDIVDLCEKEGIRDQVKIMIGGAPITQEYCDEIGADAYTSDAASAADTAVELLLA
ncbi:MAG: cobalamin-binding protein [Ruminococcaceae bacterium]|nr:cobalamin-binding protein [Oscillospiraceae bacterium]